MTETAGTTVPVCPAAEFGPGAMRLVEHDGRKIGVFNCDGSLFDLTTGRPKTLPAYAPVETFPVRIEDDTITLEV